MNTTKQLVSFMVMQIGGGTRVSVTYNEIDNETGAFVRQNVKESFIVLDPGILENIKTVEEFILKRGQ